MSDMCQISKDIHALLTSRKMGALVLVNYLSSKNHLCVHIIMACNNISGESGNINNYSLCSQWYLMTNYAKVYALLFHLFWINDIENHIKCLLPYFLNIRGQQVICLLFACEVLCMKVMKVTNKIDVVIANNLIK